MATEFDYSATDTDDDTVRKIAAEMSGSGLKPLSDDERLQRELWRQEQYQREQERKAEQEYRQAVADEAARQELADEIAERNRQRRLQQQREYQERAEQRSRNLDLSALKFEAQQSALWRNTVRNAVAYQQRQTLLNELEAAMTPPPLPAELIVNQPDDDLGSPNIADGDRFNPGYWLQKPIFRR